MGNHRTPRPGETGLDVEQVWATILPNKFYEENNTSVLGTPRILRNWNYAKKPQGLLPPYKETHCDDRDVLYRA
jgi:hypothetical protein